MSDLADARTRVIRTMCDARRESDDKVKTVETELAAVEAEAKKRLEDRLKTEHARPDDAAPPCTLFVVWTMDHDQHMASVHVVTPSREYADRVFREMKEIENLRRAAGEFDYESPAYEHFEIQHTYLSTVTTNEFRPRGILHMQT